MSCAVCHHDAPHDLETFTGWSMKRCNDCRECEGMSEAELKLLSDPDRLARVDAALAESDAAVPWKMSR